MRENLSTLVRDPKLEKLGLSLRAPNFFRILKVSHYEIRHSNFLAWLLSPNESHNLNDLFLKWFLKEIFSSDSLEWGNEFSIESINFSDIQILREWKHIDIVINHHDFVLAIENKVRSKEHSNQLSKYEKKILKAFPNKNKGFVYLTVDGLNPKNEQDKEKYISVGYDVIRSRIEIILDVYQASLSNKVQSYIEDYLLILNSEIMEEHESIDLAKELYRNHKEAIDFIIEHKPDRIAEVRETIEQTIIEQGYLLQTCNKYYARFLTQSLVDVLPNSGINGWKDNESFLFEIAYWEKGLSLKFVISPGNEINRKILGESLEKLPKSKKPSGKKWLTYYSDPKKVNFTNEKFEDEDEVKKLITKLLIDNKKQIQLAEELIINNQHKFE